MIEELIKPEVQEYIRKNLNSSIPELLLGKNPFPYIPFGVLADQIKSAKKAQSKLPVWFDTSGIVFPPSTNFEQASSEQTGQYKASNWKPDTFIDITGGTGVDSYFLSRNSSKSYFVECDEKLVKIARHNLSLLDRDQFEFVNSTAEDFVKSGKEIKSDLVFIDPSRRKESKKVHSFSDCSPDVTKLLPELFRFSSSILIKASPMLDIKKSITDLKNVKEVHVVSIKNDCKEVLYLVKEGFRGEAQTKSVNLDSDQPAFTFMYGEEESINMDIANTIDKGLYLYEPNASIMKAGGFKSVAKAFDLNKLHKNSHLYTGTDRIEVFPGRIFLIESISDIKKGSLQKMTGSDKVNLSTRNFPSTVDEIRKKFKLKEGGDKFLFATTIKNDKRVFILCRKA